LFTGICRLIWKTWQQSFMLLWWPLMQTCCDVCKLEFHYMQLHVGECMVDTLWTLTLTTAFLVTYLLCSVSGSVIRFSSAVHPDVWTVHSSYVRYCFILTHLFMSVTCRLFVVIQPSVCLPLSLSVTTNFFATYDRCDSCHICWFLLTIISWEWFLLDNSSSCIFILFLGFLPVPIVITHHFSHTLCMYVCRWCYYRMLLLTHIQYFFLPLLLLEGIGIYIFVRAIEIE
jgi:hypothetical protein